MISREWIINKGMEYWLRRELKDPSTREAFDSGMCIWCRRPAEYAWHPEGSGLPILVKHDEDEGYDACEALKRVVGGPKP